MKKVVRLLAILIVLLAASAVPSSAIIPNCDEFCSCETSCDWGCWDRVTSPGVGTNCGDWGVCGDHCGAGRGKVNQASWLVSVQPSATQPDRLPVWATSCTTGTATARPSSSEATH